MAKYLRFAHFNDKRSICMSIVLSVILLHSLGLFTFPQNRRAEDAMQLSHTHKHHRTSKQTGRLDWIFRSFDICCHLMMLYCHRDFCSLSLFIARVLYSFVHYRIQLTTMALAMDHSIVFIGKQAENQEECLYPVKWLVFS